MVSPGFRQGLRYNIVIAFGIIRGGPVRKKFDVLARPPVIGHESPPSRAPEHPMVMLSSQPRTGHCSWRCHRCAGGRVTGPPISIDMWRVDGRQCLCVVERPTGRDHHLVRRHRAALIVGVVAATLRLFGQVDTAEVVALVSVGLMTRNLHGSPLSDSRSLRAPWRRGPDARRGLIYSPVSTIDH